MNSNQPGLSPENLTATSTSVSLGSGATPLHALNLLIEATLAPLGYELVAIEIQNHREKKLRVFIDLLEKTPERNAIDIEDCVKVTHALDQPLENNPIVESVISGAYDLEVSSPGVDRPLRKTTDFDRFAGEIARINTFRPLTATETQAAEYTMKNPKQKNFYGILRGYSGSTQSIQLGVIPEDGTQNKKGPQKIPQKKKKNEATQNGSLKNETLIHIPLDLVAKAHLEPVWD